MKDFLSKQNQGPQSKKIFFNIFVKTGCVSASQFQISEGEKFFEILGVHLAVPSGNK
ncbi:hypothetical protein CLOLEP_03828 [[Clostridium] leptum DSM 753]|uniref:Uncharacterized protein n=1 Tax=[Clostridium] leptum DSM 753 TaxID=428125 RepID=A7VZ00_9FIRM|nr:hypothetical protein CLOLEP_03828 [[Clostridium] leptum DSM 753]